MDALAPMVWQRADQTFTYRWSYADSMSWGNPAAWIRIKVLGCAVDTCRVSGYLHRDVGWDCGLRNYDALRQILDIIESPPLRSLARFYAFSDTTSVRRFLEKYLFLTQVLLDAVPHLDRIFGPKPRVVLEVVRDPESEDWEQMFAYILAPFSVDEGLARLRQFDEEWFLDQLDRVEGLFNFKLEFL